MTRLPFLFASATTLFWLYIQPFYGHQHSDVPWYSLGVALLAMLALFWPQASERSKLETWPRNHLSVLAIMATVLSLQAILAGFYVYLVTWVREIPLVNLPAFGLLKLLGYQASLQDGVIQVWNGRFLAPFIADVDKLQALAFAQFLTALLIFEAFRPKEDRTRRLLQIVGFVALALVLRYLMFMGIFLELNKPDEGHHFGVTIFTLAPNNALFFALMGGAGMLLFTHKRPSLPPLLFARGWQTFAGLGALLLSGLLAAGGLLYQDPGVAKQGRILFDDYHSGIWEQSDVSMGREDYGSIPAYSYSSAVYMLRHRYEVSVNRDKTLDQLDLDQLDILVLKTPSKKYSKAEIEVVDRFIRNGGGVFFIGDHTNLLGMNTFLNQLVEPYGFSFNYDSANQYSSGEFGYFHERKAFGHPLDKGVGSFQFMTSCTLDLPLIAERNLITFDTYSDPADYSKRSFFGDVIPSTGDPVGVFAMGGSKKIEKGRIALFTDSTVFSNFGLFLDGHDTYLQNVMHWLNYKNTSGYTVNACLALIAILLFIAAIWLLRGRAAAFALSTAPLSLILMLAATPLWQAISPVPPMAESKSMTRVAVLNYKNEVYFPPGIGQPSRPLEVSFDSFFVAIQRMGLFPYVLHSTDVPEDTDTLVIINPIGQFSDEELGQLKDFVNRGGRLLISDTINNRHPHLQDLLDAFDLKSRRTTKRIEIDHPDARDIRLEHPYQEETAVTIAYLETQVGQGKVVLFFDSTTFTRNGMGWTMDSTTPIRGQIYQFIYNLFEKTLALSPELAYPPADFKATQMDIERE